MKKYIGTKEVMAEPMLKSVAVTNGWARTSDNDLDVPGYHVQHRNQDGTTYDSWSPKEVFEKSYNSAETFVERLYIEHDEVENRQKLLKEFLKSDRFPKIKGDNSKFLLQLQNTVMNHYLSILSQRINLATYKVFITTLPGMSFGIAIEALKYGFAVRRAGWNGKGMFVVKQVPAHIGANIIPNMQSLPERVKDILMKRENPCIDYTDQLLLIQKSGRADSWTASSSDIFAEDWEIVIE